MKQKSRQYHAIRSIPFLLLPFSIISIITFTEQYNINPLTILFVSLLIWEVILRDIVLTYGKNIIGIVSPSKAKEIEIHLNNEE